MPEIEQWLEWKEKCALDLCPPATQSSLRAFVHGRYCRYAAQYAGAFQAGECAISSPDHRESWHWFESYFQLSRTRQGKSYKEWLHARAAGRSALGAGDMESGVSLLLRDVVRNRLRNECAPRRILSLDADVESSGERFSPSLVELLPDGFDMATEVEQRDMARIASHLANSALEALSRREQVALFGRELGQSLANPHLLKAADCGKTALAEAHHSALVALANHVATAYPEESRATQATLTVAVFGVVCDRIISWRKAENGLSGFLNSIGALAVTADSAGETE